MTVLGRTHIPIVNNQLCQRCSVCVRACPAEPFIELRSKPDTSRGYVYSNTDLLSQETLPPCQGACPLGQKVRDYVPLLAAGNTREALLVIRLDNPLPGICGYVCHHPCEQACIRGTWDEPVAIRELKRYAAHYEIDHHGEIMEVLKERKKPPKGKKVVIVGAGPAGLACAFELVIQGCEVAIMDALDTPGGMLVGGIPAFRLPRQVVEHDVQVIRSLGAGFVGSVRLGDGLSIEDIQMDADGVVLATGAWKDLALGVAGGQVSGCFQCLEFLRLVNKGHLKKLAGTVVVIGGGNAALDTARSSLRLGPEKVSIIYRRSREEMPASPDEIDAAIREGVKMRYLEAPTKIIGERGRVKGIELMKMELGEIDETGRRRPVPLKGSTGIEAAEVVISAIGQGPELSFLKSTAITENGTVWCDEAGMVQGYKGVFAAGDAVSGPSTVVEAIASGKAVARSIMSYLDGNGV
jgi:NADPH-dependent glutamate synthase beta subunit-like oxidoreductase